MVKEIRRISYRKGDFGKMGVFGPRRKSSLLNVSYKGKPSRFMLVGVKYGGKKKRY